VVVEEALLISQPLAQTVVRAVAVAESLVRVELRQQVKVTLVATRSTPTEATQLQPAAAAVQVAQVAMDQREVLLQVDQVE
jgi:hypothetical protein